MSRSSSEAVYDMSYYFIDLKMDQIKYIFEETALTRRLGDTSAWIPGLSPHLNRGNPILFSIWDGRSSPNRGRDTFDENLDGDQARKG